MTMTPRRRAVALSLLVLSVAGCRLDGETDNPRIVNESGVDLQILSVSPGSVDQPYVSIPAGQTHEVVQYAGSCFPNDLVAKTEGGEVVARSGGLCPGDRWVIAPPAG